MRWLVRHERAAQLVANKVPFKDIATELGVSVQAIDNWQQEPQFRARVQEILSIQRAALMDLGIADKRARVARLEDKVLKLEAFFAARAAQQQARLEGLPAIPGAETGLVAVTYKSAGKKVIEEYAADTGSIAEMRNLLRQAAIELGEWTEKQELTGKDGKDLTTHVTVYIPENNR